MRKFLGVIVGLAVCAGAAPAQEESRGTIVSIQLENIDKGKIDLKIKDKERSFVINEKTRVVDADRVKVAQGLKDKRFVKGNEVIVTHAKDRDVAEEIRLVEKKQK